ncbi:hypothetical protein TNCV_1855381 [Trichonephila clavipes]|nr:hypothetical protein TNCV_1855381 [Trichonephila clavipes]
MAAVDFLHHENPPTWAGVEPAALGAEGQRKINHASRPVCSLCGLECPRPGATKDSFCRGAGYKYAQSTLAWKFGEWRATSSDVFVLDLDS